MGMVEIDTDLLNGLIELADERVEISFDAGRSIWGGGWGDDDIRDRWHGERSTVAKAVRLLRRAALLPDSGADPTWRCPHCGSVQEGDECEYEHCLMPKPDSGADA